MEPGTASDERTLRAHWLGRIAYRPAWALQQALAAARADGEFLQDRLLLVEHDPVLTLGRNADPGHILADDTALGLRGVEVVRVERGGEVTYHGPGQLVAYPIVALGTGRGALGVRLFVEALEGAMSDACAAFGIGAGPRPGHPGAWVDPGSPLPRKIGALGIRVARGVSFHGIALNVTTDIADFDLIDPCGMPGLRSTSVARERARAGLSGSPVDAAAPTTASVAAVAGPFARSLAARLRMHLGGHLPPDADPVEERANLDALAGLPAGNA